MLHRTARGPVHSAQARPRNSPVRHLLAIGLLLALSNAAQAQYAQKPGHSEHATRSAQGAKPSKSIHKSMDARGRTIYSDTPQHSVRQAQVLKGGLFEQAAEPTAAMTPAQRAKRQGKAAASAAGAPYVLASVPAAAQGDEANATQSPANSTNPAKSAQDRDGRVGADDVKDVAKDGGKNRPAKPQKDGGSKVDDPIQAAKAKDELIKRQQEELARVQKAAEEARQKADRHNCDSARDRLRMLEQGRVARLGTDGHRSFLSDEQIAQEKEITRSQVRASCKS